MTISSEAVGLGIEAVAQRSGSRKHLIRIWKRRYGAVEPVRTESNRRLYPETDAVRLDLLNRSVRGGYRICESINWVNKLNGHNLGQLTDHRAVMLVFLRHVGCIFCIKAMHRLAEQKLAIGRKGVELVTVMMSKPERTKSAAAEHRLQCVGFRSDPGQHLYEVFGIGRGSFSQLFGIMVWLQSVRALLKTGRLVRKLEGDGFQMPGFVLLHRRKVIKSYKYRTAADAVDYADFASCPNLDSELVTVQR